MAYLGNFDANTVEPADFSTLPQGDYPVIISASEWRETRDKLGQYLSLTFQVIDGPARGRFIWHNLNLQSQNSKAVEIAQRELSAICRAVGRMTINDSAMLHDIPLLIHVAYVPPKGEWPEKNQIKKWMKLGDAAPASAPVRAPASAPVRAPASAPPRPAAAPAAPPAVPPAAAQGKTPAAAQGGKTPPWKKVPPVAVDPQPVMADGDFDDDVVF